MNMKWRVGMKHLISIPGVCASLSWENHFFDTYITRTGTNANSWFTGMWGSLGWSFAQHQSSHRKDDQAVGSTKNVMQWPEEGNL